MSSQIPQQYLKKLQLLYSQVNTQKSEHITKDQLKQWVKLCLNDEDISENKSVQQLAGQFEEAFEFWVDGYLRDLCGLEGQNIEKVEFRKEQAVEFFLWILDTQTNEQQGQEEQGETYQKQKNQNKDDIANQSGNIQQNRSNLTEKNKQELKKNASQVSKKTNNSKYHTNNPKSHQINNFQTQNNKSLFAQEQPNEFSQHLTHSEPVHESNRLKQVKNIQSSTQLTEQDQRYKQYLETIFQHYCKINFGLAKDNTFESMQKNVSIITMNKFMIFSNDFELNILLAATLPKQNNQKPTKIQIRNLLMDVFKKNSAFHKQMNFQHFLLALSKIAQLSFTRLKQSQTSQSKQTPSNPQQFNQTKTKYSFEMVKMIKYLEISSFKEFKEKMTKFNINFSLKFNKQLQQKKMPLNYKFKFQSQENLRKISQHNEKSVHNQNRPPIIPSQKRNIVLKQGQQNVNRPRHVLQMGKPPLQNKMSTPNMMSMAGNNNNNNFAKDKKITGNKNVSSHQKLSSVPSNKDRNIISLNNAPQKVSKQSLQKLRTPAPAYEGVLQGYTNIHLAKKGLLPVDPSKSIAMKKKGQFQLNNVIQQARKQAQDPRIHYDYLDSRSGRALSNISASKPLSHYSKDPVSNQSYRQSRNDEEIDLTPMQSYSKQIKKNFTEVPLISKSNSRVISVHNELEGLIDFNDSDEDEYLHQHLRKEKENDTEITVRVQKKINSLDFKA